MRYYDLVITEAATGKEILRFTSHPNGIMAAPDRGALQVEFDVIAAPYAATSTATGGGDFGNSFFRIWGIPLPLIGQAQNLSTPQALPAFNVSFFGGMGKGLPLANPSQAGLIFKASIWRAVGNWIGTDMTLDLFLAPVSPNGAAATGSVTIPSLLGANNFSFHWPAGQSLAAAINATLQTAYPGIPRQILINPGLVLDRDETGIYSTLGEFADFINRRSNAILGPGNPGYTGVQIAQQGGTIVVYDNSSPSSSDTNATGGTTPSAPKTVDIAFTDLVGQPTWLAAQTIQVTCVLRSDIRLNDKITLPPTLTTVSAQGALNNTSQTFGSRFSSQFQGTYTVNQVRHVGNYKSPQGTAWVTTLSAIIQQNSTTPAPNVVTIEGIGIKP